jgi:transposase-like protein
MSSRDVQHVLKERNVNAGLTTVRKAIDVAGFVSSKPRYCQLIRDVNKAIRVDFCKELITSDEKSEEVIFTDETSIQLHDNKTVAYRQ